jgi:hypothetical protein
MERRSVRMRRQATIWILASLPLAGAITNAHVVKVSPTQIVIGYTAPSADACAVEVSEEPGFSPVVHDVDPALFPGSNSDLSRFAALQAGRNRRFVAGTRAYQRASDGRIYSRALQSATVHHIRIRCGAETAEMTASTATLPFGSTYAEPPQASDSHAGELMLPTVYDQPRGARIVDPVSGTAIYRVSRAGDLDFGDSSLDVNFAAVDASANWSNPDNALAADSADAVYDGAACAATCDWLKLRRASTWYPSNSADYVRLKILGSGDDANEANRTIEWGLGLPSGGSCALSPLDGTTRTLVLPQGTPGQVSNILVRGDMLRSPAALSQLTVSEIAAAGGICVLIRKRTSTGTIRIDHANYDEGESSPQDNGSGGNPTLASDVKDANGFTLFTSQTGGARAVLYKVKMEPSVDIRYLGYIGNIGGGQCLIVAYSPTVADRMYCAPSSTGAIYQLDYTGDSTNKTAPYAAEIAATLVSPDVTAAVDAFVALHAEHYPVDFDPAKFRCDFNAVMQGDLLQIVCRRGIQNTYAWAAVWKLGTGIVAAYPTWTQKTSRWCGHHSHEEIGQYGGLFLWTTHFFGGENPGGGPYRTTLAGGIGSFDTSITLAGQLSSPNADTALMDLMAGDTLLIGGELMTITSVANFPTISVRRGVLGSAATPHANGETVEGMCAGDPDGVAYQAFATMVLWDPIADPYGDGSGITNKTYRGHETIRPGLGVNNNAFTLDRLMPGADLDYSKSVLAQPPFAGRVPPAAGVSYQTHPTKHTTTGGAFAQRVFADTRPLIGGNLFSAFNIESCDPALLLPAPGGCAAQRVAGTSNVYKYTFSGSDRPEPTLAYRQMPIFATSGRSTLKNISGPGSAISDATPFTFCIALAAGECRNGSVAGDLYLSAPGVTFFGCKGGELFSGASDLCIMERAAGTLSLTEHSTHVAQNGVFNSRDLALVNTIATTARFSSGANIKHLPDGTGILFTMRRLERSDLFIAKVPPYEGAVDSVNRQSFLNVPVTISDVPAGATRVLVKFGYGTDFRCSPNRDEACYAASGTIDPAAPFLWESELTNGSGVDVSGGCAGPCAIAIPAIADRVGFYQLIYGDGAGAVVQASPVEIF